jgi:hypothetical protein
VAHLLLSPGNGVENPWIKEAPFCAVKIWTVEMFFDQIIRTNAFLQGDDSVKAVCRLDWISEQSRKMLQMSLDERQPVFRNFAATGG